jgi:putative endonuclease
MRIFTFPCSSTVERLPVKKKVPGSNPGGGALRQAQCFANMKYYLYILLCDQKTFYVGITRDIKRRTEEHENKESFYTKKFSDIKLVYTEEYSTQKSVENREKQIKGWTNAKKKALISGRADKLAQLSKAVSLTKPSQG